MLGALVAGLGSLLGGAATGAVSLGSSVLGGLGGLATTAGSLASSGLSLAGSTASGLAGATSTAIGTGAGILGTVAKTTAGVGTSLTDILASEELARAAATAGGIYSFFNKPEAADIINVGGSGLPMAYSPVTSGTLPNLAGLTGSYAEPPIAFSTPPQAPQQAPETDYMIYVIIAAIAFFLFYKKR